VSFLYFLGFWFSIQFAILPLKRKKTHNITCIVNYPDSRSTIKLQLIIEQTSANIQMYVQFDVILESEDIVSVPTILLQTQLNLHLYVIPYCHTFLILLVDNELLIKYLTSTDIKIIFLFYVLNNDIYLIFICKNLMYMNI